MYLEASATLEYYIKLHVLNVDLLVCLTIYLERPVSQSPICKHQKMYFDVICADYVRYLRLSKSTVRDLNK